MPSLELVADLPGHAEPAWSVAFNPTKPILASSSTDKTVRLYAYHLPASPDAGAESGAAGSSSSAGSSSARDVRIAYHSTLPTDTHKRTVRSLAWSPGGATLATGSFDASIGIWAELTGDEDEDGDGDGEVEGVERVGGRRAERDVSASGSEADEGAERGSGEDKRWECVTTLEGHESEVKSVGYSADGSLLASCSRDKSVWIWEVQPDADFECIAVLMEHTQDVKCLAWHPAEEILASGSYDASILMLADDPDGDWSPFQKLQPKKAAVAPRIAAVEPAAAAPMDASSALVIPPLKEPETVWSLAFSPCGRWLASGGDAGGLRIWQRTGRTTESPWVEMGCWEGHAGRACYGVAWQAPEIGEEPAHEALAEMRSEDEVVGRLVTGGGDGRILLWEALKSPASGNISLAILHAVPAAHNIADVNAVTFCHRRPVHPDAFPSAADRRIRSETRGLVASCGDDGSVKVWAVVE